MAPAVADGAVVSSVPATPAAPPSQLAPPSGPREQMRARYPDAEGFIERDGIRTFWERYGEGAPPILFAPTWSIVHSRIWKAQVPYFARRHKVITLDARGNGRSDRPPTMSAYAEREMGADLLATLDATETERAMVVSLSLGAQRSLVLAAEHPERVAGLVFIAPSVSLGEGPTRRSGSFDDLRENDDDWNKYNRHFWLRDYPTFLEFFFGECFTEPHSTKQIEDAVGWGGETDAETLIRTQESEGLDEATTRRMAGAIGCPTLVIQGLADAITGPGRGLALAEAIPDARLATISDGGHIPNARDPVLVNLLIRDFIADIPPRLGLETR